MISPRHWALVPAAGVGKRMGSTVPKQYLPLVGRPVIAHALATLLDHPRIAGVVVAIGAEDEWWPTVVAERTAAKPLVTATGGAERCHSVCRGLDALRGLAAPDDWVLVHDAARPCLGVADLERLMVTLADDAVGGLLAVPVRDTLKQADSAGRIATTVDRAALWQPICQSHGAAAYTVMPPETSSVVPLM